MGMMYSGDGNEMVHDMINMIRLGWSTSGMFYNPILAALGPEFLFLETVDESKESAIGGQDADDSPVVRFVNKMLMDAIRLGSSDLHFEPYEKIFRIGRASCRERVSSPV